MGEECKHAPSERWPRSGHGLYASADCRPESNTAVSCRVACSLRVVLVAQSSDTKARHQVLEQQHSVERKTKTATHLRVVLWGPMQRLEWEPCTAQAPFCRIRNAQIRA